MNIENSKILKSEIGETLFAPSYPQNTDGMAKLDVVHNAGWHRVNRVYKYDRPNGIKDYLLIFTVSGKGEAYIGERKFELVANTVFIVPPYISSGYHTAENETWEFYWMHIDGINAANILSSLAENGKYLLDISYSDVFKKAHQIINPVCILAERYFYAAKIISKILFEMIRVVNEEVIVEEDIIDELVSYLEQECVHINLKEFASKHYMSVTNLIRIFSKKTGKTPYSYHREYKLTKAAQRLIYSKIQIKTISSIAGYSSKSAFSTQFFKMYGISPKDYRNKYKVYQN